ncbi:uncharacterized protein [Elaeis guineensis]|uniref:uncharacterized protein n=1 Tax=Elaeis guineensis var. tenera TaxID=51953 RepID=UPI003C6D3D94
MASEELNRDFSALHVSTDAQCNRKGSLGNQAMENDVRITCFTADMHDLAFHFQIIKLTKQIYVWVGCNSARFGHLYAAPTAGPNIEVSVTSLNGGCSDNTGSSIY